MINGIHRIQMHYNHSSTDPCSVHCIVQENQSFGATLKFEAHFSRLMELTILGAFSMKMSSACSGMLSSENYDSKLLKTAKNLKCTCITCTIAPWLV